MRRTAVLAALASTATLVAGVLSTAVAATAPKDPSPPGPAAAVTPGPPQGDADGDRISDDFEPRLRSAGPGDRLEVIVEGLRPGRAREHVGRFDLAFDLPIVRGFAGAMNAAQVRALLRVPGVERISQDGVVRTLDDAGNHDFGVDSARAERAGLDGSGVGICVVDTGVHPTHEQLTGRVVGFYDAVNGQTAAYDDQGHGTHVAAIAAGAGPSEYQGVAPAASIYAAKVLSSSGTGSDSQVIAGVEWCAEQEGVKVISMSLGDTAPSDGTDPLSNAVNAAVLGDTDGDGVSDGDGDVVVVAAGNSGDGPRTINAPGVAENVITVGAASDHSAPVGTARRDDGIWLAAFSSRGPALRPGGQTATKPDVTAPGVTVTAARSGTTNGYITMSGTSMATPFVAGAAALALEADAATLPLDLKAAVMGTAADRGEVGTDNDWGAGLLDVRALVDAVAPAGSAPVTAGVDRTAFPTAERGSGSVARYDTAGYDVVVPSDATGAPLVVMLTVQDGSLVCDLYCQIGFTAGEWSPDIDMRLYAPNGTLVTDSQCTLSGVTCAAGRQETVAVRSPVAGTYRLEVYEWSGSSGSGADFMIDVSRGPLVAGTSSGGEPPPDEEPINQSPTANAGQSQTVTLNRKGASFTLDGSGSSDPDGTIVSYTWSGPGLQSTSGVQVSGSLTTEGTYTYTLVVRDDDGAASSPDTVTVTVVKPTKGGGGGGGKPPKG